MLHRSGRARWVALIAAAAFLSACGDDDGTDPSVDYDPQETIDRLDAVLQPLDLGNAVFDGLWLGTQTLYDYGAAPLAEMVRISGTGLIGGSVPEAATLRRIAHSRLARPAAGTATGVLPKLVFPSSLEGRTLVWDPAQQLYVVASGRDDAPDTGVRIVYYTTDGSGYPTSSLNELGHIDLFDEDRSLAERVGVRVVEYRTGGQDRVLADYYVEMTVTGSNSAGTLEFESAGDLTPTGDVLGFDLTQRFTWSQSQDYDRLVLDYLFDSDRGPMTMAVAAESRFEADVWDTVDFSVALGSSGSDQVQIDVAIAASGRLTGDISQGGRRVVEVSGTDGAPVFERRGGGALAGWEIDVLEQVWVGLNDVLLLTSWLLVPGDLLVLSG